MILIILPSGLEILASCSSSTGIDSLGRSSLLPWRLSMRFARKKRPGYPSLPTSMNKLKQLAGMFPPSLGSHPLFISFSGCSASSCWLSEFGRDGGYTSTTPAVVFHDTPVGTSGGKLAVAAVVAVDCEINVILAGAPDARVARTGSGLLLVLRHPVLWLGHRLVGLLAWEARNS